jgi:hypothetical protein
VGKMLEIYYLSCWIEKEKQKHGTLVNGVKLGGMAPLTKAPCFFFLPGSTTLVNSWRLGWRRYVLLDALTNGVMPLYLELRRETSRKRLFGKIHLPVDYSVLKDYKLFLSKSFDATRFASGL